MVHAVQKEVIFGFHAIYALLTTYPEKVVQIFCQAGREDKRMLAILDIAKRQSIPIHTMSKNKLDHTVDFAVHQGIVAEIKTRTSLTEQDLFQLLAKRAIESESTQQPAFLLLLDEIQDPHNLGACLRSANAAGVDAVIIPQDRSVSITPAVRKIAAGAADITPVITVTNLANTLRKLKKTGMWLYGLDEAATELIYNTQLTGSLGLIVGAEGKGLRRLTRELCDGLIAIPMLGSVSSLNVSVAAGVCLFEAVRQRQ